MEERPKYDTGLNLRAAIDESKDNSVKGKNEVLHEKEKAINYWEQQTDEEDKKDFHLY